MEINKKDLCFNIGSFVKEKRVKGVAYSGGMVFDRGPFGRFIVDLNGAQFKKNTKILYNHDPELIIGKSSVSIRENRVMFEGELYDNIEGDERANKTLKRVKSLSSKGTEWEVSCLFEPRGGIENVLKGSEVINGVEYQAPFTVIRKPFIRENSIVSLGADAQTDAVLFGSTKNQTMEVKEINMATENNAILEFGKDHGFDLEGVNTVKFSIKNEDGSFESVEFAETSTIKNFESENSKLIEKLSVLETSIEEKDAEIEKLGCNCKDFEKAKKEKGSKLEAAMGEIEELKAKIKELSEKDGKKKRKEKMSVISKYFSLEESASDEVVDQLFKYAQEAEKKALENKDKNKELFNSNPMGVEKAPEVEVQEKVKSGKSLLDAVNTTKFTKA